MISKWTKSISRVAVSAVCITYCALHLSADTIPSGFRMPAQWRIGVEAGAGYVPGTNEFLKGENREGKTINSNLHGALRADFSFNSASAEGMLYKGLYQGVGVNVNSFFAPNILGTPLSVYVYQGAPIVALSPRLTLGYEWRFGAAFGWKHFSEESAENKAPVSTSTTAHMGLGLKLQYRITEQWNMTLGVDATHYSNGNTSIPNAGVNSMGASIGLAYTLNPQQHKFARNVQLEAEADSLRWIYDIIVYGAWRKRILAIENDRVLCPGKFGVIGIQFAPMLKLNRWVAVGPSLDMQYDESAGLSPYWVEGSYDENIKFHRPPFGKQLSIGLSAHAELTMPIFSVNAGLGYDMLNPVGNRRFYQSLALKTFVTKRLFLNIGYRLGEFKEPQNLMLGVGIRL